MKAARSAKGESGRLERAWRAEPAGRLHPGLGRLFATALHARERRKKHGRGFFCLLALLTVLAASAPAREIRGARPGDFDGYILALSWSPTWCALEGRDGAAQCDPAADIGFIVHGLWPQKGDDWPAWCRTVRRDPTRRETAAMTDLMGSAGLAWYQWKKHGRCTGLDPADYFALVRNASGRIRRPAVLRRVTRPLEVAPRVIEEAFLAANPGLAPDMVTVTCEKGYIDEVRVCLDRDLRPAVCPEAARRDCALPRARLLPVR